METVYIPICCHLLPEFSKCYQSSNDALNSMNWHFRIAAKYR